MQPHRKIYITKLIQPRTGISETNFHCLKIKVKFRFNINTAVHIVFYFYKIISIVFPLIETVMVVHYSCKQLPTIYLLHSNI